MKTNSLYLSASQVDAGEISISLGFMQFLKTKFQKVAYFKPIVKTKQDNDLLFIKKQFSLKMEIEDMYLYDLQELELLLSNNNLETIISNIIDKYNKLLEHYDFILMQGLSKENMFGVNSDLNFTIAKNLSTSFINIINGYGKTNIEIAEDIKIQSQTIKNENINHFATFINKVQENSMSALTKLIDNDTYILPYIKEVDSITMHDVYKGVDAKLLFGTSSFLNQQIAQVKVASMMIDNFLQNLQDNDLIIVSGDRTDIISVVLLYLKSKTFKRVAGIILTGNLEPKGIFQDILNNIENFPIVVLSHDKNTYETTVAINKLKPMLTNKSYTKISLLLGSFSQNVDLKKVDDKLNLQSDEAIMTPIMFEYNLFNIARKNRQHIVLPESEDDRILRATEIVLNQNIVDITLLGVAADIRRRAKLLGLNISNAKIIDPKESQLTKIFADEFYNMRKNKGISQQSAMETIENEYNYFATMMVHLGYASGMVSGASHTTANTVRPALQIIKTIEGVDIVSSVFFMCLDTKVLVYGDCAINQNPSSKELAQIAMSSARTAKAFNIEPKIAMLSYSTGNSGTGEDVQKVSKATKIAQEQDATLLIDGPIQYDAAIDSEIALKKLPDSKVAGHANVLIFPDLNTGNNTYKAVQRSSGAVAIGPVLQGLKKPVNDLSRGCTVKDIINTIAITAIQAQTLGD